MHRRLGGTGAGRRWVVLFDGAGSISFSGAANEISSSSGRYEVEIDEGSSTEPAVNAFRFTPSGDVTNIRIISPGGRSDDAQPIHTYSPSAGKDYETTHIASPWFPDFANEIAAGGVVRFMNWAGPVNNTNQHRWAERPLESDQTWSIVYKGVPVEVLIDLANTAQVRPWFTLPHLATDNYISQYATLVRDSYNHSLGAPIFEYSNEASGAWAEPVAQAFTATAATDRINDTGHGLSNNDEIMLIAIGDAIGLSLWVKYHVINITANDFQVAASEGGAAAAITADSGAGTYEYKVLPYGQAAYGRDRGAALGLGGTDNDNEERYYSRRTSEMIDLLTTVYAGSGKTFETVVTIGVPNVLDHETGGVALKDKVTAGGGAFYFGSTYTNADLDEGDTTDDMILELLNNYQYGAYGQINSRITYAADRGLKAYFYEGGHHFASSSQSDARFGDLIEAARYEYFYQDFLNNLRWYAETHNSLGEDDMILCHYTSSRGWNESLRQRFGIRRYTMSVYGADSAQWRAFTTMVDSPGAARWP